MRKERVLSWVEPGVPQFFPQGKGESQEELSPQTSRQLPGGAEAGPGPRAEERGLRSEKPQPRPQTISCHLPAGALVSQLLSSLVADFGGPGR